MLKHEVEESGTEVSLCQTNPSAGDAHLGAVLGWLWPYSWDTALAEPVPAAKQ